MFRYFELELLPFSRFGHFGCHIWRAGVPISCGDTMGRNTHKHLNVQINFDLRFDHYAESNIEITNTTMV